MKTSYPKDRIKAVLVEGIHAAGAALLRAEGFQVEMLAGAPDETAARAPVQIHCYDPRAREKTPLYRPSVNPDLRKPLFFVGKVAA